MNGLYYTTDKLSTCQTPEEVNVVLDELGVEKDLGQRALILGVHMGVKQTFGCAGDPEGLTPEEEYALAVQQLFILNERRKAKV
ncbi:MAG: hypothetical protein FWD90_09550 [Defluviitaleaceae bacterium]|nr:hypothetical protein [Defluviitaleaceae bacterium]